MTKKDFLYAMKRGLGRAILAAKKEPEKFREIILKNCAKDFAYDTQCEGTRSWYTYQLISCYDDIDTFIKIIADTLRKTKSSGEWKIAYLSDLLSRFAMDGSVEAQNALWEKYEELYAILSARQRAPRRYLHERDNFEKLCVELSYDLNSYRRIAKDIGRLFLTKTFYHQFFDWLYKCNERKFNGVLKKEVRRDPEIKRYIEVQIAEQKRLALHLSNKSQRTLADLKGWALSHQLAIETTEVIEEYAYRYLNETDEGKRADALQAFVQCPYPLDPTPIIADTNSKFESLKEAAFEALGNIRHPLVREFAVTHLNEDMETIFPVFVKNYLPEDEEWLFSFISNLKIDFGDTSNWHSYHFDIEDMFDKKSGIKNPPKELLPILYNQTLCSCCRERFIKSMGKQRMLTKELLNECLYDSNDDIRVYAQKKLKRRKK